MRIQNCGNGIRIVEYDKWLEKLGDGKLQTVDGDKSFVTLPEELCRNIYEEHIEENKNDAISSVISKHKRNHQNGWTLLLQGNFSTNK